MKKNNVIISILSLCVLGLIIALVVLVNNSGNTFGDTQNLNTVKDINDLVGKDASDFSLPDITGKTYSLADLKGKNIVLFFNEGLMCYPACWSQVAALGADARLNDNEAAIFSVVVDPPAEWQNAIAKMPALAAATVLFDTNRTVSKKFGMLTTPSSMHYGSLPGHSYVVIDKNGKIVHVYDDPNMALHNDQLVKILSSLN